MSRRRLFLLPAVLLVALAALDRAPARAQPAPGMGPGPALPPPTTLFVGSQRVTGPVFDFDGDIAAGTGPFTQITVTNATCASPTGMPGAAQAGVVALSAALAPAPGPVGMTVYAGTLQPLRGTMASGTARVVTPLGENPESDVDVTIAGLSGMAIDTTFNVCLTAVAPTIASTIAAVTQQVAGMSYDVTGVITTTGPNNETFIAVSGFKVPTADAGEQFVFFFVGTRELGTDTLLPSRSLQLTGSPAPGQINVQYANYAPTDPFCCPSLPPVTITYTWDGTSVTPNGTPPGH